VTVPVGVTVCVLDQEALRVVVAVLVAVLVPVAVPLLPGVPD
jgi:hypothetical protein